MVVPIDVDFAREVLATVRAFLQLGMRTQLIYRIILDWLYYYAHHLGRALLGKVGLAPHQWRANLHCRVIDKFWKNAVESWKCLEVVDLSLEEKLEEKGN